MIEVEVITCPLATCGWAYEVPRPVRVVQRLERRGVDVLAGLAPEYVTGAQAVEVVIREHLRGHTLQELIAEMVGLRDDRDAARREIAWLRRLEAPEEPLPILARVEWCPYRPEALAGAPMGQHHCPSCGCMVIAGMRHGVHEDDCAVALAYAAGHAKAAREATHDRL